METETSADGTEIAYERTGTGRALIVCLGAFCTRQTFVATEILTDRYSSSPTRSAVGSDPPTDAAGRPPPPPREAPAHEVVETCVHTQRLHTRLRRSGSLTEGVGRVQTQASIHGRTQRTDLPRCTLLPMSGRAVWTDGGPRGQQRRSARVAFWQEPALANPRR